MSSSDFVFLDCGCVVLNGRLGQHCVKHYNNQPIEGDPLWHWLNQSTEKPVAFNFFNDGKKDVLIRTSLRSSKDNPERIKPLELKTLYLRPKGFMKLWDYEDCYHLLVE